MRAIRTVLATVLEEHAGSVDPTILIMFRGLYGELALPASMDTLRKLRAIFYADVAAASASGYSDFVVDLVSVDDAFGKEIANYDH